ncbi:MAG: helix-turn-helix transcriptional regulator [bacterium]|nr:helix-turn-helix transcriptional regulator [bacterium]
MNKKTKKLGEKISSLREKQKLTQTDFAKRLNLTTEYISLLERGLRSPSLAILENIETILGASLKTLLDIPDDKIKDEKKKQKMIKLVYLLKDKSDADIDKIHNIAEIMFDYGSKK